ncbi:[weak similarity to] transcriptional activator of the formate hydrogenlyase system, partial [methanotrophic bacterial endosymbiont of Bathymodiolus sp.]
MSKQINHIPQAVMENLLSYHWPGNIRELENVIERAVILSPEQALQIPVLHSTEKVSNADTHPLVSMAEMER